MSQREQAFSNIVEEYILYGREEIVPIPLRPEIIEEGGRVMGGFTAVLEESELEAGAMRAVDVEGVYVLVSRSKDGQVCAVANACTHRGGPLNEGQRESNVVTCPWHGSQFDLCSGEMLRGPAREPQQHFEARLREGKIEVRSP